MPGTLILKFGSPRYLSEQPHKYWRDQLGGTGLRSFALRSVCRCRFHYRAIANSNPYRSGVTRSCVSKEGLEPVVHVLLKVTME